MKSLLMTLVLMTGLAAAQLNAQSCCTPCPPQCCTPKSCKPGDAAAKCDVKACTPEQLKSCTAGNAGAASAQAVSTSGNRPQPAKPAAYASKQVAVRKD